MKKEDLDKEHSKKLSDFTYEKMQKEEENG